MPATPTPADNPLLESALRYADQGLAVLPLHAPNDGRCDCGKARCSSPGKHPRTERGVKDATTDPARITSWWTRWPTANIGVATGGGLTVLDIDGPEGLETLAAVAPDPVPCSGRVTTGRGDTVGSGTPIPSRKLGHGLDVKGVGGYVVAPPSTHPSGKVYVWVEPLNGSTGGAPAWLLGSPGNGSGPAPADAIPEGQRNDTLYRMGRAMHAKGMSPPAIEAALQAENTARCDPPLSTQEVTELARKVATQPDQADFNGETRAGLLTTDFSEIVPERLEWLWRGRILQRKVNGIAGVPGVGKSFITLDMAARVSTGAPWPDGAGYAPLGNVLIVSDEDDPADTIHPRLVDHGADLSRVIYVHGVMRRAGPGMLNLDVDRDALEATIREKHAILVIIDPILSYTGRRINPNNDSQARQILTPLAKIAARTGAAFVLVMHLNKKEELDALNRVSGAVAFIGVSRSVLLLAESRSEKERYIITQLKLNLGKKPKGLAYRIVGVEGADDRGRVEYESEPVDVDPEYLTGQQQDPTATARALGFLRNLLKDGRVLSQEVEDRAEVQGISTASVKRARKLLGVESVREGGRWLCALPGQDAHV